MTANSDLPRVSIVIPTHNPRHDYLSEVLDALRGQTLPVEEWELVVIDNGSRQPLAECIRQTADGGRPEAAGSMEHGAWSDSRKEAQEGGGQKAEVGSRRSDGLGRGGPRTRESELEADRLEYTSNSQGQENLRLTNLKLKTPEIVLGWHPNARVVREEELGLTHARLRGFDETSGDLIVMVDDDNVLAPDYLATAVRIAQTHAGLGAFGGRCLPSYECTPPPWIDMAAPGLGLRDLGSGVRVFPEGQETMRQRPSPVREFPACAPIGAGMVVRRAAAQAYSHRLRTRSVRVTDRRGDSLASAGDNDLCLTVLEEGWQLGYFPELSLQHLIPERRLTLSYHRRMAREAMRSFVLMLDGHGIRPWPAVPAWSVPLRVARDAWRVKPWQSPEHSLRWCMNRGRYEACGQLGRGASA